MALVEGKPIDIFCDTHHLTLKERIELFIQVCHALQYAHQKGIIHRDIKPSNILVSLQDDKPLPKIIDFGLAKATRSGLFQVTLLTQAYQIMGTPLYMSPEQAGLTDVDVGIRTDIYALGVVLYELLVGTTPYEMERVSKKGLIELFRVLREEEPKRPSLRLMALGDRGIEVAKKRGVDVKRLRKSLQGDLDWIVMKCLEKDRDRRYPTVAALAEDLDRYLQPEPVVARPPSAVYRVKKFIRRNRFAVGAAFAMMIILILGVVGTTRGMLQAERALKKLEEVAAFQEKQLSEIAPEVMGERLYKDLLEKGKRELQREGLSEEAIKAELKPFDATLQKINFTDVSLKVLHENIFDRALQTIEKDFADKPILQARLYQTMSLTLRKLGLWEQATKPQKKALALRRQFLGDDHPNTITSMDEMATLLYHQGKYKESEGLFREALKAWRRIKGSNHPRTLTSMNNLAQLLQKQGNYEEAEGLFWEALETRHQVLGDDHPDTLISLNNLATLLEHQEKYEEAERLFQQSIATCRRVLGKTHTLTLVFLLNMGRLLVKEGKFTRAIKLLEPQEPIMQKTFKGGQKFQLARCLTYLAKAYMGLKNPSLYDKAEKNLFKAHEIFLKTGGEAHKDTKETIQALVHLYQTWDQEEPGQGYAQKAQAWKDKLK